MLEIDDDATEVVRRMFTDFAAGLSSIQIATRLNEEGVPGPRGGEWNASTIRGDPKKLVGILNNPLYVGRLVWGRRQWRKNPDSDSRERRYRLRDRTEWVEVEVPELRIIDDATWEAAQAEMERRRRQPQAASPAGRNRARHLLSGLIRCSCCGSNYTISGKYYYRCAGETERGTCGNKVSVWKAPLESATLAVLKGWLLTQDHARIFAEEFEREMLRRSRSDDRRGTAAEERLRQVDTEISKLTQNFLSGLVSPTLMKMLSDREAEKARLEATLSTRARPPAMPHLPPPTALLECFSSKVQTLRCSLDNEANRPEAAAILSTLIESVTIYPGVADNPEAEVVAKVSDLLSWATNDNAARRAALSFYSGGCGDRI